MVALSEGFWSFYERRFSSKFFGLAVFCFLFILFTIAVNPVQAWEWRPVDSFVLWEPDKEAERLAGELLDARSISEIESLIFEVLGFIGVTVYDEVGNIILPGNEDFSEEFYLYNFQVSLLARSFEEKRYIPLNNVIQLWGELGLTIKGTHGVYEKATPETIERAMRSLRSWAEENPHDPGGFIIRLIDELGDREEYSFDLLGQPEDVEFEEPLDLTGIMKESLRQQMKELLEYDDTLDLSEEEIEAYVEAAIAGDTRSMMVVLMGEEEVKKLEEFLPEIISSTRRDLRDPEGLSDMIPEERRIMEKQADHFERLERVLAGDTPEEITEQSTIDTLRDYRDASLIREREKFQQTQELMDQLREEQVDALRQAQVAERVVWALYELGNYGRFSEDHEEHLKSSKKYLEWARERGETGEREHMPDPLLRIGLEDERPLSNLILDPLQFLLLQLDLLIITRDSPQGEFHSLSGFPFLTLRMAHAQSGSNNNILGTLGDGLQRVFKKGFGEYLQAEDEMLGKIKKRIDLPGHILNVLHGTIIMLAHRVDMEIEYMPEADAELGRVRQTAHSEPPPGIRLRDRYENRFDKRIRLLVTVTFDPPEAVRRIEYGRLAAASFIEAIPSWLTPRALGPAREGLEHVAGTLADLEFPEPGPQADVPVKITFDREIQRYVEFKMEEWDVFGQGIVKTGDGGVAEVNFYLDQDSHLALVAGGQPEWVKEEGFLIRAHPLTQVPDSPVLNWGDIAFGFADQMQGLFPGFGSTDSRARIERLKPTPWEGTVTVKRTIRGNFNATYPDPVTPEERQKLFRATTRWIPVSHNWSSVYEYSVTADVFLAPDGSSTEHPQRGSMGLTTYDYNIKETAFTQRVCWHTCGDHEQAERFEQVEEYTVRPEQVYETVMEDGIIHRREVRPAPPEGELKVSLVFPPVHHWTQQYRIIAKPPLPPLILHGFKEVRTDYCDEGHKQTYRQREPIQTHPQGSIFKWIPLHIRNYPSSPHDPRWWAFDTQAMDLAGQISWDESPQQYSSRQGNISLAGINIPTITIHTTLSWNLKRVMD